MEIMRNILAITLIGVFSQASMAQNQEVTEALQEIASIVISINHFPSDENKTVLERISGNNNLPQGVRLIASSVSDIQHSPNEQGKQVMSQIQAAPGAPEIGELPSPSPSSPCELYLNKYHKPNTFTNTK